MTEELALFGAEVLAEDPFNGYPLGSYWKFKYDRGDGEHHTVGGVIYEHRVWNNQWRIDQYQEYADRGVPMMKAWLEEEEYREEPQLVMYTGYAFRESHWGSRIWISSIKKATRLHGLSIKLLHQEWQTQHDQWARNPIKHAEWWSHPERHYVGWEPVEYQGPCDHKIWRLDQMVGSGPYQVTCVCGEVLAEGIMPEHPCLWWSYVGCMGNDRIWTPHPDDCHFCQKKEAP